MNKETTKSKYYPALLHKVVLTILLTAMIPTLAVSLFILYEFRTSYQKKVYDHLELLARKHAKNIDLFLEEKLMDIHLVANTTNFTDLSNESTLNRIFVQLQRAFDRAFVDIGVVNHEGRQIAYAGPHNLTGAMHSEADWFKKAITSSYSISDVFQGLRGEPHCIVTVRNEQDGKPWILRATIDFRAFNNIVEFLRIGKTGFAFILNRVGQFQTRPLSEIKPEKLINLYENNIELDHPNSILRQNDPAGKQVVYATNLLKNGEWMMPLPI